VSSNQHRACAGIQPLEQRLDSRGREHVRSSHTGTVENGLPPPARSSQRPRSLCSPSSAQCRGVGQAGPD
jgi:hypothetical protein